MPPSGVSEDSYSVLIYNKPLKERERERERERKKERKEGRKKDRQKERKKRKKETENILGLLCPPRLRDLLGTSI